MNWHSFLRVEAQISVMNTQCESPSRTGSSAQPPREAQSRKEEGRVLRGLPSRATPGGRRELGSGVK